MAQVTLTKLKDGIKLSEETIELKPFGSYPILDHAGVTDDMLIDGWDKDVRIEPTAWFNVAEEGELLCVTVTRKSDGITNQYRGKFTDWE